MSSPFDELLGNLDPKPERKSITLYLDMPDFDYIEVQRSYAGLSRQKFVNTLVKAGLELYKERLRDQA